MDFFQIGNAQRHIQSGTGVLADDARGEYAGITIYDDANVSQIESLAPTQPHRLIDLEIVAADLKSEASDPTPLHA